MLLEICHVKISKKSPVVFEFLRPQENVMQDAGLNPGATKIRFPLHAYGRGIKTDRFLKLQYTYFHLFLCQKNQHSKSSSEHGLYAWNNRLTTLALGLIKFHDFSLNWGIFLTGTRAMTLTISPAIN